MKVASPRRFTRLYSNIAGNCMPIPGDPCGKPLLMMGTASCQAGRVHRTRGSAAQNAAAVDNVNTVEFE